MHELGAENPRWEHERSRWESERSRWESERMTDEVSVKDNYYQTECSLDTAAYHQVVIDECCQSFGWGVFEYPE